LVPTSTPGSTLTVSLSAGNGELYKVLQDTSTASTPANLSGVAFVKKILLNWSDSNDPQTGVDYYVIYRDGAEIGTSDSSDFADADLQPNTAYQYEVSAVNGEGVESARSAVVSLTTLPPSPADLDGDGDVDVDDFSLFQACAQGPNVAPITGCASRDLDSDGDVDQSDFGVFQRCYDPGDAAAGAAGGD
jgi:chitodextrinase